MAGWLGWLGGLFLPVTLPPHFVRGEVTRESEGFAEQIGTRLEALPGLALSRVPTTAPA